MNTYKYKIYFLVVISFMVAFFANTNFVHSQNLLTKDNIQKVMEEAYNQYKNVTEGANADYIPALAEVDPNLFGIVIVTPDGSVYKMGNTDSEVSVQSISKVFTLAMVIENKGPEYIMEKIGVDATGMKFNAVNAVEYNLGKEINSCVNPGAIATTSLVEGADYNTKWNNIIQKLSEFAGRELSVNQPVYESEAATNQHNQAIAVLMLSYERMYFDPAQTTDIYTKQCAINVNATDLGVMAGTFANGGTNPVTGKMVVSPMTVEHVLPVMATAGLYDDSGIWLYKTGIPGKSGVGGGIIAVAPGKMGIGVISPPLDAAGNSVKAQYVIRYIVDKLGLNPYLVQPK